MALRQRARFSWKPARLRRYHREDQAPQQLRQVAARGSEPPIAPHRTVLGIALMKNENRVDRSHTISARRAGNAEIWTLLKELEARGRHRRAGLLVTGTPRGRPAQEQPLPLDPPILKRMTIKTQQP